MTKINKIVKESHKILTSLRVYKVSISKSISPKLAVNFQNISKNKGL